MSSGKFGDNNQSQMAETTLELLNVVEDGKASSQRNLALQLGVALGLTKSLIKRCITKGLLKVQQAPARRSAYYLTPKGFHEKSRLTREYLTTSLHFFRISRSQYKEIAEYCHARGWTNVVFHGATELTEIAALACREMQLPITAVIDPERNSATYCDLPVIRNLDELKGQKPVDAVIIVGTKDPQGDFDRLSKEFPEEKILTPEFLRVSRNRGQAPDTPEDQVS